MGGEDGGEGGGAVGVPWQEPMGGAVPLSLRAVRDDIEEEDDQVTTPLPCTIPKLHPPH